MYERAALRPPSPLTFGHMTSTSKPLPFHAATLVAFALMAAGCPVTTSHQAEGARPSEGEAAAGDFPSGAPGELESVQLTVAEGDLTRTAWAVRSNLYLPGRQDPEKLDGPVQAPLTGTLSPAAVDTPGSDGAIAYSSFLRKRPVVRAYSPADDTDVVIEEGAYSPVWGRDGGLAYFKGLTARVKDPARHLGHVVVRASPRSKPVRWSTTPRRYVPSAWAGEGLIVHELNRTWPTLLVFDGAKRRRVLAKRAGLVALSADGTRAFIAKEPDPSPAVAIIDIANGRELANFTFSDQAPPNGEAKINYVADSGAWAGETVIAAVTNGLAVFRVRGNDIKLEQLLGVDPNAFPTGLTEPKSDDSGRYISASAELMQEPGAVFTRTAILECDRVELRCALGPSAPSFLPPRLVYNPSRPS